MKETSSTSVWMPLYIGSYLKKTIGLTNAEHGAYLLSMMAYWQKGEALTWQELKAICGKEVDRVCRFYVSCDRRWHHERIDEELKKAYDKLEARKARSKLGVEARRRLGQLPERTPRR